MKTSTLNPTTKKSLKQLGFKRKPHEIKPDVDWSPEPEREPQAPNYSQMWIDHFSNFGNVQNPLGSPMESGS